MVLYCALIDVQNRLQSKVKFAAAGVTDPNQMTTTLANSLIQEAESQLEIDLMDRYSTPFVNMAGAAFGPKSLPTTTWVTIKNLAELLSMIRIMETDFGRGTSSNSDKYTEKCQKRYDDVIKKLMTRRTVNGVETREWNTRPLDGLMVAYNNTGDNGFRGRVHNTTTITHEADYATKQINSPGETIFNGLLDHLQFGQTQEGGSVN